MAITGYRENTGLAFGGEVPRNFKPILKSPVRYEKDGVVYEISCDIIRVGGESQVYHAVELHNGRKCAAKIYTSMLIYDPIRARNREKVLDFLKTHTEYKQYHIMPLLASGVIEGTEYPVDIFPFCDEGDLRTANKRFDYGELRDSVIPSLNIAIKTIHDNNFIHRDIKPENIYLLDGEIVLGDFGVTVPVENDDENEPHYTSHFHNTAGYSAPEVYKGYITKVSDYFSLGCTLATLYNGVHPCHAILLGDSKIAMFNKQIEEQGIMMNYRVGDESLRDLIDVLVRNEAPDRAGFEGIALWLHDSDAFNREYVVSYSRGRVKDDSQWKEPFEFYDGMYFWNEKDLADAVITDWATAKKHLYRGNFSDFFVWKQAFRNEIVDIIDTQPTRDNDDLGCARFLHHLHKSGRFHWCGKEYTSLAEISSLIWQHEEKSEAAEKELFLDEIIKMLQGDYLSWKMKELLQASEVPEEVKSAIQGNLPDVMEIESISKTHPVFAYYYAMLRWSNDPELNVVSELSPDEQFAAYTESPSVFFTEIAKLVNDDFTWATIAAMGYRKQVVELKDKLTENARENIESIYTLFEDICSNKSVVRSHYAQYGPDAYLYWIKSNLSLYTFHSNEALRVKNTIETVKFHNDMTLVEIRDCFRRLNGCFAPNGDFHKYFQGDFVIACLGLTKGKDRHGEITATHADAFFMDNFFGRSVPTGFRKSINLPLDVGTRNVATINLYSVSVVESSSASGSSHKQASSDDIDSSKYCDVILQTAGTEKIELVKAIREIIGLGLKEAKDIVDNVPAPVVQGLSRETANLLKERLSFAGTTIVFGENKRQNDVAERSIKINLTNH
jgi:ribosomal protein L7/L12